MRQYWHNRRSPRPPVTESSQPRDERRQPNRHSTLSALDIHPISVIIFSAQNIHTCGGELAMCSMHMEMHTGVRD